MSVSSISSNPAPLPYNYLDNNTQPVGTASAVATPDTNSSSDASSNNDATQTLPPAPAPLPPGQGTRVDQLV
jgi:hypothetical protein